MHAPKQHSDSVFRRFGKALVPKDHLPIKSPALDPKGRAKETPVGSIAGIHEALQVMSGNELMMNRRPGKVDVVSAHAHELRFIVHGVGRKGNDDRVSTQKERIYLLPLRRHHKHPPGFLRQRWNRH